MWVRLVVGLSLGMGLLWTALLIQNLLSPEPNAQYALSEAAFAFFFVEIFFVTRAARLENETFLKWLAANAGAIRAEGVEYEGILITPATVLTRYQVVFSFLIISSKIPTRYYRVGNDATGGVPTALTIFSLLFGWWAIPWGPVYTVQVIARNLRGGLKETVGELLATLQS